MSLAVAGLSLQNETKTSIDAEPGYRCRLSCPHVPAGFTRRGDFSFMETFLASEGDGRLPSQQPDPERLPDPERSVLHTIYRQQAL